MHQMWGCCNQEFTVLKQVQHLFDENQLKMFKPKVPLYLLEGVTCSGEDATGLRVCDHCCYLFWHEDWLVPLDSRPAALVSKRE